MADAQHWNDRYATIGATAVSWFEPEPSVSLELLDALGATASASVIDVGGGASTLVDRLVARGHDDVTVLDVSRVALDAARARVGAGASWIEADLLSWVPPRQWDVWHDRAVLHFLTDEAARDAYVAQVRLAVAPGGAFVIGVFAEDGPTHCSALPVQRYAEDDLVALLGDVEVVEQRRHVHHTPGGAPQPFNWIAGRIRA